MQHGGIGDRPVTHADSVQADAIRGASIGDYRISTVLGEGPTGVVHRCVSTGRLAGRQLVMKVLHRELCHPTAMAALRADLERLTRGADPHVVHPLDCGFTPGGQLFVVCEEMPGPDLGAVLEETGAVNPERAVEVLRQACLAVESAHCAGVVHGGLKPRNLFLLPGGEVRVSDFAATRRTGTIVGDVLFGDPRYMAPEQLRGFSDTRSDVFSLGVLLHELLTGELPSARASGAEVALGHLTGGLQAAPTSQAANHENGDGADHELKRIWKRALDPRPSARFATVGQLRAALESWGREAGMHKAASLLARTRSDARREVMLEAELLAERTHPVRKVDLGDMARLAMSAAAPEAPGPNGQSESIEASLEDFISQASKSFGEPSEGWSLNTDEVELIESDDVKAPPTAASRQVAKAPVAAPRAATTPVVAPRAATPQVTAPTPAVVAAHSPAPAVVVAPAAPVAIPVPVISASATLVDMAAPVMEVAPEPVAPGAIEAEFSTDPSVPAPSAGSKATTLVTAMPSFDESSTAADAAVAAAAAAAEALLAAPAEIAVVAPSVAATMVAAPTVAPVAAPAAAVAVSPAAPAAAPVVVGVKAASLFPLLLGAAVGGAVLVLVVLKLLGPAVGVPTLAPVPAPPAPAPPAPIVTPTVTPIVTPTVAPTVAPAPSVAAPTSPAAAPAAATAPAGAPAPAAAPAAPVVTPLPAPAAAAPVVTPIPAVAAPATPAPAPEPAAAAPAAPAPRPRHHASAPKPAPKAAAARPAAKPAAAARRPAPEPAPKPAVKPAAPSSGPKKPAKKGDDWSDPFAG